jgi:hypothetical protein
MDVATTDLAYQRPVRRWKPERCDRIALVLQGGGALGAYQPALDRINVVSQLVNWILAEVKVH